MDGDPGNEVVGRVQGNQMQRSLQQAEELAVSLSSKIARDMSPYVDGYYLMTPFERVELVNRILIEIRKNL